MVVEEPVLIFGDEVVGGLVVPNEIVAGFAVLNVVVG